MKQNRSSLNDYDFMEEISYIEKTMYFTDQEFIKRACKLKLLELEIEYVNKERD